MSPDFRTFLLGTAETELVVGDVATGSVRLVSALGRRASTARFSPDGKRFAAARHSDYGVKQAKEDDTIYVFETATLAFEQIPAATEDWPASLRWANDGSAIWVRMHWEASPQWITLRDKVRDRNQTTPPESIDDARRPAPSACPLRLVTSRTDSTIRVVDANSANPDAGGRTIVELRGRKRGFHDHGADFVEPAVSPGCAYVVFGFERGVWVADAHGGAAAPLAPGARGLFFAPRDH